jgi:uncharacterized protein
MDRAMQSNWHIVRLDSVPASPWRNGGGVTRELLARPDVECWSVRMSVAEVSASGPFSRFDGVTRWFAVLSGDGVRLRLGDRVAELNSASPPFMFDGGVPVDCELIGSATQDFNLMLRGRKGAMARVCGMHDSLGRAGTMLAVYASRESASIQCSQGCAEIPANALAWRILESDAPVRITGADMLWMEIAP